MESGVVEMGEGEEVLCMDREVVVVVVEVV